MKRARQKARVDHVACPADFAPAGGLSGDRETATAQAAAELIPYYREFPIRHSRPMQQPWMDKPNAWDNRNAPPYLSVTSFDRTL